MEVPADTRSRIVEALSQIVSRPAAENLLRRVLVASKGKASELGPTAWVGLIEGPLQRELARILPVGRLLPPLQTLVQELKKQAQPPKEPQPPAFSTVEITTEYFRLSDPLVRQELLQDLARAEGVTGVVLQSRYGLESRLGGHPSELTTLLGMAHRLLAHKRGYRLFYTVLGEAQVVLRPFEQGWLAVLALKEANLGQLLYRLSNVEAATEDVKRRSS